MVTLKEIMRDALNEKCLYAIYFHYEGEPVLLTTQKSAISAHDLIDKAFKPEAVVTVEQIVPFTWSKKYSRVEFEKWYIKYLREIRNQKVIDETIQEGRDAMNKVPWGKDLALTNVLLSDGMRKKD